MTRWKGAFVACLAVLSGLLLAAAAGAQETEDRLPKASEGLQMPGSEADSVWWFVSYPDEDELPSAERFSELAGCGYPEGGVSRQNLDATLDHLGDVQPWMDRGQKKRPRVCTTAEALPPPLGRTRRLPLRDRHAEVPIYLLGVNEAASRGSCPSI
jgi:hypothetical protein